MTGGGRAACWANEKAKEQVNCGRLHFTYMYVCVTFCEFWNIGTQKVYAHRRKLRFCAEVLLCVCVACAQDASRVRASECELLFLACALLGDGVCVGWHQKINKCVHVDR